MKVELSKMPSEQNERAERKFAEPTPGPWDFDTDDLGTWINCAQHPQPIAKLGSCTLFDTIANARLIAAAPDMLAALEQIVRYADSSTDPAITKVARAAAAKATGAA